MDDIEKTGHSFIIRIWKENRECDAVSPLWRGRIEHLPSGRKRYFQNLAPIIAFIIPYLEEMGVKSSLFWRCLTRPARHKGFLRRHSDPIKNGIRNHRPDEESPG